MIATKCGQLLWFTGEDGTVVHFDLLHSQSFSRSSVTGELISSYFHVMRLSGTWLSRVDRLW